MKTPVLDPGHHSLHDSRRPLFGFFPVACAGVALRAINHHSHNARSTRPQPEPHSSSSASTVTVILNRDQIYPMLGQPRFKWQILSPRSNSWECC